MSRPVLRTSLLTALGAAALVGLFFSCFEQRTVTVPGRIRNEPFRMISRDPEMAAGTTSTPA